MINNSSILTRTIISSNRTENKANSNQFLRGNNAIKAMSGPEKHKFAHLAKFISIATRESNQSLTDRPFITIDKVKQYLVDYLNFADNADTQKIARSLINIANIESPKAAGIKEWFLHPINNTFGDHVHSVSQHVKKFIIDSVNDGGLGLKLDNITLKSHDIDNALRGQATSDDASVLCKFFRYNHLGKNLTLEPSMEFDIQTLNGKTFTINSSNDRLATIRTPEKCKQYILFNENKTKYIKFGNEYTQINAGEEFESKILGKGSEGIIYNRKNPNAPFVTKQLQINENDELDNKKAEELKNHLNNLTYTIYSHRFTKSDGTIGRLSDYLVCGPVSKNSGSSKGLSLLIPNLKIAGDFGDNSLDESYKKATSTVICDLILAIQKLNELGFYQGDLITNLENVVLVDNGENNYMVKLIDFGKYSMEQHINGYGKHNPAERDEDLINDLKQIQAKLHANTLAYNQKHV